MGVNGPGTYDGQIRRKEFLGSREIKASAVFTVMPIGGTLDGSKFPAGGIVLEGQCLARNKTTKLYEPYGTGGLVDVDGSIPATHDNPVVLDQSIRLTTMDDGTNSNMVFGQALMTGKVYRGMCIGVTPGFEAAMKGLLFITV